MGRILLLITLTLLPIVGQAQSGDEDWGGDAWGDTRGGWQPVSGFVELAGGQRLNSDPLIAGDGTLRELRGQMESRYEGEQYRLAVKADLVFDDIADGRVFDLRELSAQRSFGRYELKAGRQVLTWGTGDYLFLNDLFPKDWQSFFGGRDDAYLKAPSTALKLSRFGDRVNLDLVWIPRFEADRYLTGERFSFFSPAAAAQVAPEPALDAQEPDRSALAARLFFTRGATEWAFYGYHGYAPQPLAVDSGGEPGFYRLDVLGTSLRRPLGRGLANVEIAYHHTADGDGSDPGLPNSQWRALLGYQQELRPRLTLGLQYYTEITEDHAALIGASGNPALEPDHYRHLVTVRTEYRSPRDRWRGSLFLFHSPSDRDAYLRPQLHYRPDDRWRLVVGANLFAGRDAHTLLGQQEDGSNLYFRVRYHY